MTSAKHVTGFTAKRIPITCNNRHLSMCVLMFSILKGSTNKKQTHLRYTDKQPSWKENSHHTALYKKLCPPKLHDHAARAIAAFQLLQPLPAAQLAGRDVGRTQHLACARCVEARRRIAPLVQPFERRLPPASRARGHLSLISR